MSDFVRVRDKRTGHEYSVVHVTDNHEVVNKRAVDSSGQVLPPKHKSSVATKKASESKAAPSGNHSGGEPVENPNKEGSK